jgi:hypothetical protein
VKARQEAGGRGQEENSYIIKRKFGTTHYRGNERLWQQKY